MTVSPAQYALMYSPVFQQQLFDDEQSALPGISGGGGEHKLYSTEGFADDESHHPIPVLQGDLEPNVCFRCKTVSDTRSRCCRKCYQTRDQWMPPRPTRKLRKREYSLVSSDEDNVFPQPPLSKYSNLRRLKAAKNPREDHSSSEEFSPREFVEERRRQRLKRRAYVRKILEKAYEDTTASSSDVDNVCMVCQTRPLEVVLVHEKVAHLCVCKKCAVVLDRNNEKCPACGKKIHYYFSGCATEKYK